MSDSQWSSEIGGSWSLDYESVDLEVPTEATGATPASVAPAIIVQSQGLVDPKEDPP